MSSKQFMRLVEEAVAEIPPQMAVYLENVVIDVEDMPDAETCASMELDDPAELMGLYHGTPLTERSVEMSGQMPDRIVIYQRNIEREARSRREIIDEVRTTVLHEIGHHFGLDEDALDDLGYG
ncbi:MAG: metallopeptidase family protein [Phycisphaerales bacterium]|nr:metallopeptidase family protein [Phycisphaerales bacterium]